MAPRVPLPSLGCAPAAGLWQLTLVCPSARRWAPQLHAVRPARTALLAPRVPARHLPPPPTAFAPSFTNPPIFSGTSAPFQPVRALKEHLHLLDAAATGTFDAQAREMRSTAGLERGEITVAAPILETDRYTCDPRPAQSRRALAAASRPALPGFARGLPSRAHVWRGQAGQRHLFSVYSLIECPPLAPVAYLLVRRGADGRRDILASGSVEHAHATLNLAALRYQGATLGANEVHVSAAVLETPAARAALAAELAPPARPAQAPAQTEAYCSL